MSFRVNGRNVIRATLATMLISASFHLAASLFFALKNNNPDYANMFNIIGVSWFFPQLATGDHNSIIGTAFVILSGVGVYYLMEYHDRQQSKKK